MLLAKMLIELLLYDNWEYFFIDRNTVLKSIFGPHPLSGNSDSLCVYIISFKSDCAPAQFFLNCRNTGVIVIKERFGKYMCMFFRLHTDVGLLADHCLDAVFTPRGSPKSPVSR